MTVCSPKMKRLKCACGREWEVPSSRGRYPEKCEECRTSEQRLAAERRAKQRAELAEIRAAERDRRRAEHEREKAERRAERNEAQRIEREEHQRAAREEADRRQRELAEQRRRENHAKAMQKRARDAMTIKARKRLDVLFEDIDQAARLTELLQVSARAARLGPLERRQLSRFVRGVALAEGTTGLRNALLDLAASALAAASAVPDKNIREPDPREAFRRQLLADYEQPADEVAA